jgi:hypothetical protein
MRAATGETRNGAFYSTRTGKVALTMWTLVQVAPSAFVDRERKIMTALLVRDSKIAASPLPVGAVRQDPAPTGAKLGENMSQFMAQGAIDFGRILNEQRIQRNQFLAIIRATSSRSQTRIPFDAKFPRHSRCAVST